MNAAFAVTAHWLPELAPTLEARDAALELYKKQCSPEPGDFVFYHEPAISVWGFIGRDAVLLFASPKAA